MLRRPKDYLRGNWGATFVGAFIFLLIASAALLSEGYFGTANSVAVYAFYALVLCVILQVVSYVRVGKSNEKAPYVPSSAAPSRSWRPGRRISAVIIVIIFIAAAAAGAYEYKPLVVVPVATHTTIGPLKAGLDFITAMPGPQNSVQVIVGINETGGVSPYSFTAYWGDGFNQSNAVGVFVRSFLQNETIPSSMKVIVESSDKQTATVLVTIPYVNGTSTTYTTSTTETITTNSTTLTTSTTSTGTSIVFVELGLPSGTLWSVNLSGLTESSNTNQIVFNLPPGVYNYSVSEPYDSQNFSRAFIPSPSSGFVTLTKGSQQVVIDYSTLNVDIPTNQIFKLQSDLDSSFANGSEEFDVTYSNSFPVQIDAIIFAIIKSNSTGLVVTQAAAPTELEGYGEQSSILLASGLAPGNYYASIYVQTADGVKLSQTANVTFTIT